MNEKDATTESKTMEVFSNRLSQNNDISYLNDLLGNEYVKRVLHRIDQEIIKHLGPGGEPKVLYDTALYLLKAGGKRLRSLLVVLCCDAVGGDFEKAIPYAAATEFAQTASLIHDDVIDEDALRRGVKSTHEQFGHKMAILAGDLLVAQAVKMVGKFATGDMMIQIAEAGIQMCEGEATDMLMQFENPEIMTKAKYMDMIDKKTVSFIKSAAAMGAALGDGSEEEIKAFENYGENLGYAFQIRDDILNIISSPEIAGKTVHSDLLSKRCTYPLVHALEAANQEEREECLSGLARGDLTITLDLINRTEAIPTAIDLTKSYVSKAKESLSGFDFNRKEILEEIADFILQRLY